jgi:coenzyme F420-reducing hydrogenase beta subunit
MEQWLGGIEQASFLLTNSFHGMMAALKLHTPFAIFLAQGVLSGMNDRFFTLLDLLGLLDRIVSEENPLEQIITKQICWDQIDRLMESYAEESERFLKENCIPSEKRGPVAQYRNAECCGCTACQAVCPAKCIHMVPDREGFLYPEIDEEVCIKCGRCAQVCPVKNSPVADSGNHAAMAFVARAKDDQIVAASSSGGVFTLLARQTASSGGVVFAVAMSEDCRSAVYQSAENENQLAAMRGSKYVQSRKGDVFLEVKQELDAGREVLFCGTPCDVNGLYNYLRQTNTNRDNLLLVDFICHGTPSPLVWEEYVSRCEKMAQSAVVGAEFRNKTDGWRKFSVKISFENREQRIKTLEQDLFLKGFLADLYLRPSCHECAAKGWKRVSDFTVADAWGVEHYCTELADDKGTSLVLVNSEKAERLFAQLSEQMWFAEVLPERAIEYNSAMLKPSPANVNRMAFMAQLPKAKNLETLIAKYCKDPFVLRMKKKVKRMFRGT